MKTTAKLSFMMFVEWFIWGAWFVPLWLWLSKSGFSAGEIGWSYACTAIAAILSPILVGSITDRFFSAQKVLAVLMFAGALDDTIIGNGVIIDNQCQIAHNVVIGDNTAVAGGVIMAGSLKIGRYCMIGGASVINGHMEICDKVTVTGMGMVMRPITEPGVYSSGIPLQPNKVWRKTAALVMNIDDMSKRLKSLERKVNQQD